MTPLSISRILVLASENKLNMGKYGQKTVKRKARIKRLPLKTI
jgi:hypothetical protein